MKVLVVSSKYSPEYSGSGYRARNTYLRLLEKYDITFEVVCSSVEFTESKQYRSDEVLVTRVVSSLLRKFNNRFGKGLFRRITNAAVFHWESRIVTRIIAKKDFDLIHVYGYSPATIAAINWSRKKGVPLILEIVNPVLNPYQYLPGTRHLRSYDLTRQSVIVAISEYILKICKTAGLSDNVWTRPNPVDSARFTPIPKDPLPIAQPNIFGFKKPDKVIVYVAKFLKRKNHSFLIDVLKELPPNFKLVLAGPPLAKIHSVPGFTIDDMVKLTHKAKQLKVLDRLILKPEFVDFAKYLAMADVTCFPSVNEGMGTPLLESLACGVPVVANIEEPSFIEHIINDKNGYLRPLDAKQWADAIVLATKFPLQQRQQFAQETLKRYSTDIIDANYLELMMALNSAKANECISVANVLRTSLR